MPLNKFYNIMALCVKLIVFELLFIVVTWFTISAVLSDRYSSVWTWIVLIKQIVREELIEFKKIRLSFKQFYLRLSKPYDKSIDFLSKIFIGLSKNYYMTAFLSIFLALSIDIYRSFLFLYWHSCTNVNILLLWGGNLNDLMSL